jgi:preprotein translocase subunit SecE
MAERKKLDVTKTSKLREVLSTEYKWETYLIGFLSIFSLTLSLLMLTNVLTIKESTPIIGNNPLIFEILLLVLSIAGLVLFAIPFFRPAIPELSKLSFPTWRVFVANTTRVFIFLFVVVLLFLLYEAFITAFLGKVM